MPEINPTDLLETFEEVAAQKRNGVRVTAEATTARMLTRFAKQIEESDVLKGVEKAQIIAEQLRTLAAAIEPDEPARWTRASLRGIVSLLDLAVQMGYLTNEEEARLQAAKAVVFAPRKAAPAIEGRPDYVVVHDKDGAVVLHRRASTASAPKHLVAALAAVGFTAKAAQEALLSVVMGEKVNATGGGITVEATEVAPRRGRKAR